MRLEITAQVIKFFFFEKKGEKLPRKSLGKGDFFRMCGTISGYFSRLTEIRVPSQKEMRFIFTSREIKIWKSL